MTKKTKKMFEKNKTKTFPFATQNLKKKKTREERERENHPPKTKNCRLLFCCFFVENERRGEKERVLESARLFEIEKLFFSLPLVGSKKKAKDEKN